MTTGDVMKRLQTLGVAALSFLVLLAPACGAQRSPDPQTRAQGNRELGVDDRSFEPSDFVHPTDVSNEWLPLEPGTKLTWEGHARDEGARIRRGVVLIVTDLTKVIDGVRTVVVWERDYKEGELEEAELAFFAQDNGGNVWHFGEYPEEYDHGNIVKTPLWIAGIHHARPGIAMTAAPHPGTRSYAQGWGPEVNWADRAKVYKAGQRTCVPVDCYKNVLVTDEFNRDEPGAHQLKYYAPGVGNVRVGWRGAREEEREVLVLAELAHLSPKGLARAREEAAEQEERAYRISRDVYGRTPPAELGS